jgi:uncharacterized cupredoxin-like copper-binding protein
MAHYRPALAAMSSSGEPYTHVVRRTRSLFPLAFVLLVACEAGGPVATPPITPGSSGEPREVNVIARDYQFEPSSLDLVPGETVILHVINGGLEVHEAILGDATVQDAWERAEAAVAGAPPGPTPVVSVRPGVSGIRIVVNSGQRVDLEWMVPADAGRTAWTVGCHIPGHWEKGMQVPVRWVAPPEVGA